MENERKSLNANQNNEDFSAASSLIGLNCFNSTQKHIKNSFARYFDGILIFDQESFYIVHSIRKSILTVVNVERD